MTVEKLLGNGSGKELLNFQITKTQVSLIKLLTSAAFSVEDVRFSSSLLSIRPFFPRRDLPIDSDTSPSSAPCDPAMNNGR